MNNNDTILEYRSKVTSWLSEAKRRGATHIIVAYDTKKSNPFPVYISSNTNVQQKINSFNNNEFVRALEVYNMNMDIDTQLLQARTWNV